MVISSGLGVYVSFPSCGQLLGRLCKHNTLHGTFKNLMVGDNHLEKVHQETLSPPTKFLIPVQVFWEPMKTTTQRNTILELLQEAGNRGVTSYAFTYIHNIKQAPTRIYELRKLGHSIQTKRIAHNSYKYILDKNTISEPAEYVWTFKDNKAIRVSVADMQPVQQELL